MIGKKLRSLRKNKKYTQKKLADKLNISRQAISNWETGKVYPDLDNLILLSKIYNISIDNIIQSGKIDDNSDKITPSPPIMAIIFLLHLSIIFYTSIFDLIVIIITLTTPYREKKHWVLNQLYKQSIVFTALRILTIIVFYIIYQININ